MTADTHLGETERQEEVVRERFEANGADPSALKDLAGKAGDGGCSFDGAVQASLRGVDPEDLSGLLNSYLADAHAIEQQALGLLEKAPGLVEDDALAELFHEHLAETRGHAEAIEARLRSRGSDTSMLKDAALRLGALNLGGFFGAQPDTTAKLAGFAYAFENLEVGAYELLKRVATLAGDTETAAVAERILGEERAAAEKIAAGWDRTMRLELAGSSG